MLKVGYEVDMVKTLIGYLFSKTRMRNERMKIIEVWFSEILFLHFWRDPLNVQWQKKISSGLFHLYFR